MNLWNFSVFNFQLKPLGPNERVTCTTTCLIRWGERLLRIDDLIKIRNVIIDTHRQIFFIKELGSEA